MLITSSLQEMKRREAALSWINREITQKGRSHLYDLTGLSGGFPLKKQDIQLLETYAGPAIFEEKIQPLGKKHLGGEKVLTLNRTSSGILATILALVTSSDEVVHYLPQLPSHPSIPRSVELVGADYRECTALHKFEVRDRTALVIITGSTMDHEVIHEDELLKVVEISKSQSIPVLVDDASGARLRTIIHQQKRALDLGADLVITSTDKLMDGPRGGLMAGRADLIDSVKSKALQFGLEAQAPLIAGMVRALENFSPEKILNATNKKKKLFKALKTDLKNIEQTPTGIMLKEEGLMMELKHQGVTTSLNPKELANILAMLLLKDYNIITIPAVAMPGASSTIRLDMASKDAERLKNNKIVTAFHGSLSNLINIINDESALHDTLFST